MKFQMFFFTMLLSLALHAQSDLSDYQKTEITVESGLPQNTIVDIYKDANSYYWILTYGGVTRWNGTSFNKSEIKSTDTMQIPAAMLARSLYKDSRCYRSSTTIWYRINSKSKLEGVHLNPGDEIFKSELYHSELAILSKEEIKNIYQKNSKDVADRFLYYFARNGSSCSLFNIDSTQFYFITNYDSVYYYSAGKIEFLKGYKDILPRRILKVGNSLCILFNNNYIDIYKEGKFYKSTYSSLVCPDPSLGVAKWGEVQYGKNYAYLARQQHIIKIQENDKGELEISLVFQLKNWNNYTCFYYDDTKDRLVLGTATKGCEIYVKKKMSLLEVDGKEVSGVLYTMATGTKSKLINNVDFFKKIVKSNKQKWEWGDIGDILLLKSGQYMFGFKKQIVIADKYLTPLKIFSAEDFYILQLIQIDSLVFYSTGGGIGKVNLNNNTQTKQSDYWPEIYKDKNVCLGVNGPSKWELYATFNGKLCLINLLSKKVSQVNDKYIPNVRSVYFDAPSNTVIITTQGYGIFYSALNGKIQALPNNGNEELKIAHYIAADKDGDMWIPTNSGIFLLNRSIYNQFLQKKIDQPNFVKLDRAYGLATDEFNGGFRHCYVYLRDTFYMASMAGYAYFSPTVVKKYVVEKEVPLLIHSILIDDIPEKKENNLVLSPYFKEMKISADAAFFVGTNLKLQYRIVGGGDSTWSFINLGDKISIKYTRPGNYKLEMRIISGFRYANKTISFTVNPYWYNTWQAYVAFTFLILFFAGIFLQWRTTHIGRKADLKIRRNREKLFSIISHDLRTPVNTYLGLTQTLQYLLDQNDTSRIKAISYEIDKSGRQLSLLMNNLFNWSISEQELIHVNYQKVDYEQILNEVLAIYETSTKQKEVVLNSIMKVGSPFLSDKNLLSLILRNIIDNAIKNSTKNSVIELTSVLTSESKLHLKISNSINPDESNKIKSTIDSFKSGRNVLPGENGLGFGLIMLKNAISKLDGQINIICSNNQTFIVDIIIPARIVS